VEHYLKENKMKRKNIPLLTLRGLSALLSLCDLRGLSALRGLLLLFVLLVLQAFSPAQAQESIHRVVDRLDLPGDLNPDNIPGCIMEFSENWTLNPAGQSVSKVVNEFTIACEDSSDLYLADEAELRIKEISYEFSFLDLQQEAGPLLLEEAAKNLQAVFIELISRRFPIPEQYNPHEELLSIYFYEEWVYEAGKHEISKQVKGITPVIWQQRKSADGEAVPDAETGYPVFYKLKLERIDLRQPGQNP